MTSEISTTMRLGSIAAYVLRAGRVNYVTEKPDGCCHRTRLKDAPCPAGLKCPYIKEGAESHG